MASRNLVGIQQIQHRHVEMPEKQVRHGWRQNPHPFQHVVQMRLGDSGAAREAAFRQFTPLNSPVNIFDQPELQQLEIDGARQWK